MSRKTQVFLSRNNTNGVSVAHSTTPALNTDYAVTLVENTQPDSLANTPLETLVDIFLPIRAAEVRLGLWEFERIHATVEMSVSRRSCIPGDHDDRADRAVLR
jgi:hypothetical protein